MVALNLDGIWRWRGEAGCRRDQGRSLALRCPQVAMVIRNVSPRAESGVVAGLTVCPAAYPEAELHPDTQHKHFYSLLSSLTHTVFGNITLTKYNKNKLPHAVITRCIPPQMGHVHEKSERQTKDEKGAM